MRGKQYYSGRGKFIPQHFNKIFKVLSAEKIKPVLYTFFGNGDYGGGGQFCFEFFLPIMILNYLNCKSPKFHKKPDVSLGWR